MTNSIWRVDLVVLPKDGVNDPQGEAVKGGLAKLGHGNVSRVRVGRHLHLDVRGTTEDDVRSQVEHMAEQLLANPIIEQYSIAGLTQLAPVEVS
jgi:phosphoribosylformylglycinamidine synthase PurS subunit